MDRVKSQERRVESRMRSEVRARGEERGAGSEKRFCLYTRSSIRAARSSRRGVLLLVVLSMLVLFMLIGTAFLMTSDQSRTTAKFASRQNRVGNNPSNLHYYALMQLIRDTDNPNSAAFGHSLLRDFYGSGGFQGVVYQPRSQDLPAQAGYITRYAGASTVTGPLGQTQGHFIDIYVRALGFSADDPLTPTINEASPPLTAPDTRHVVKLERNALGQAQLHTLPLTKGYFNGCLLTITGGPARGQSTRIVDYEYLRPDLIAATATTTATRIFRFRVMSFGRNDGQSLVVDPATFGLTDLAGASFIVNGRPFSGTGVGYNPLAAAGKARLTAMELLPIGGNLLPMELALLPNGRYFNPRTTVVGALSTAATPFMPTPIASIALLHDPQATTPILNYPSYIGPGDANEGYDAADFQNFWLALQTVTPRAQGRVVTDANAVPVSVDEFLTSSPGNFLRLDLEDVPLPSFHRPDLVNFWYHRLLNAPWLIAEISDENARVRAILDPYGSGIDPELAAIITGIKRKIMMRPLREDHPHFDGGNPQFDPENSQSVMNKLMDSNNPLAINGNIAVPYWEAVGPWDVDNDNDGVPDSVWIDLGDPVIEMEDGTRVKALYAPLIIDLDGKLNVNAHGLVDDIDSMPRDGITDPTPLAYAVDVNGNYVPGNLAGRISSNVLPQGLGYGPAEVSLRSIFPRPTNANAVGNRVEAPNTEIDSYAALLGGRVLRDGGAIAGRYGAPETNSATQRVTPGTNYDYARLQSIGSPTGDLAQPDLAARMKFFDYPESFMQRTAFGTPPDLLGRYALGLDYTGQPFYEVLYDRNPRNSNYLHSLLVDSPYELDLSNARRADTRGTMFANSSDVFYSTVDSSLVDGNAGMNDDAPFAVADLERVLRAWDADSGSLPSRLWDVVDALADEPG